MIGRKHKQEVYIPVPLVNLSIYTSFNLGVIFLRYLDIVFAFVWCLWFFDNWAPNNFTESCLCYIIEDIEEMMFNMFGGWKLDACLYMEQKIHWK